MKFAKIDASAQPEKRLFISLLTRDINLAGAALDLIDNSINSAIIESKIKLNEPSDYIKLLDRRVAKKLPKIDIAFTRAQFSITDTCGGIPLDLAEKEVFRFGRPDDDIGPAHHDTLSVYGIGLKRAIFKLGDHIVMESNHPKGGFLMDLRVQRWQRIPQDKWSIPISKVDAKIDVVYGTNIVVKDLYSDIAKRLSDGSFEAELIRIIAKTYTYFLERIVTVTVNGKPVEPVDISFGENMASDTFVADGVTGSVLAGISKPAGKFHTAEIAGWYVFCNGRAVAFADKSNLTGWGTFLPSFQPKHRPFIGLVFFTAEDPEDLPWTTTKSGINQESAVWQHALRKMGKVGKQITSYLDRRYPEEGVQITSAELSDAAGRSASALRSLPTGPRTFKAEEIKRKKTSIQIKVDEEDIKKIKEYLGKRSMSNAEVGHYIFDYFLKNVVEE